MGATYTRQSTFTDGDVIDSDLFNNEYDQLLAAFASSTGHTHDGTAGEGGPITGLITDGVVFGTNTGDITLTWNAGSNDGLITWKEDEDYFEFNDDLLIVTNEKIQFRDTAIYINSSADGQLDIVADTEIQIAATTIDINGNVNVSGTLTIGGAGISEAELEILDGATVTTAELNILDGVTSTAAELNILDGVTSTFTELNLLDGVTSTTAELNILDGVTSTAAELNILDGVTSTAAELNILDGKAFLDEDNLASNSATGIASQQSIKAYVDGVTTTNITATGALNSGSITSGFGTINNGSSTITTTGAITGGSFVIGSADINENDLESIDSITAGTVSASKAVVVDSDKDVTGFRNITLTGELDAGSLDVSGNVDVDGTLETDALSINGTAVTSTAEELNILDGVTATAAELNILDGVTSTATELNILDGVTSTTAELNILDGVTSTTAELNILDGVTSTAAELNILDGVTSTASELNTLDGITAVVGELNALDIGSTAIGTAVASKAVILDANKDSTGIRNLTLTGDLTIGGDDLVMATNTAGMLLIADGTNFNPTAVSSLSEISTAASGDIFLAIDASGGGLKKITRSTVIAGTGSSGDLSNVVEDETPQLGGNLDMNGKDIITTSNATLDLAPNGTGTVVVRGNTNSGAVVFNCESNSHGQKVFGQPHSASVTNTLMLPAGANSTLVSLVSEDTLTNKTLTSPKINENVALTSTASELNVLDGITAVVGELNALDIGSTAVGTAVASKAVILDSNKDYTGIRNFTITGDLSVAGTTTVVDSVTMTASNAVVFEGATADAHETTLTTVDATADRTITLPNVSGTVPVLAAASNTAITSTPAELNILDGVTSTAAELNILDGVTSTAAEINLIDGGTSRGTTAIADGDGVLINDGGTMRMTKVETLSTYMSGKSVGGSAIVTTGALNAGSITSGFGTIDTGSSAITTTGLISGGSLDIDNVLINGTTIGHTDDTDLMTVADGLLTVAGEVQMTTLDIGGTNVTSTAAELNILDGVTSTAAELNILDGVTSTAAELNILDGVTSTAAELNILDGVTSTAAELNALDGITAVVGELNALDIGSTAVGTAVASKAVILDSNKDYTGIRNLTISGELDAGSLDISGNADIDGTLETDALSINGTAVTSTAAEINLIDGGTSRGTTAVADGDGILINDNGTMRMTTVQTVSAYMAAESVGGGNIVTTGALNSGTITSGFGTINNGSSTITTSGTVATGAITAGGNLTRGGTVILDGSITDTGDFTIDVAGEIILDADTQGAGNGVILKDAGTAFGSFFRSSSNFHIKSEASDQDMIFMGNDGGTEITALTLDMSNKGSATFNTDASITVQGTNNEGGGQLFLKGTDSPAASKNLGQVNFGNSDDQSLAMVRGESTAATAADLVFLTEATGAAIEERMRISSTGSVFIGKTSSTATQDGFEFRQDGECVVGRGSIDTVFIFQDINTSGNTVGSISITSNATAYNTSSDYRLKENVDYTWDATTRLKQLKPARFNFISDDTNTLIDGFLAHEAQAVVPEAVFGTHNETKKLLKVVLSSSNVVLTENIEQSDWTAGKLATTDADENEVAPIYSSDSTWVAEHVVPKMQGIDQSKLVPLLVKTIQELEARITALEG